MNFNEFEELLEKANLKKSEFANLVEMNTNSVSNWSSSNKIPPWVKSWLENYIKAKNYSDMRNMVLKTEKLYPIIMEKILSETDPRYEEQAFYTYREVKDIEQTIHMIRIASSINADAGHLIGCNKEKIKILHDYLEAKNFKPTGNDENIIVDFMNHKTLDL